MAGRDRWWEQHQQELDAAKRPATQHRKQPAKYTPPAPEDELAGLPRWMLAQRAGFADTPEAYRYVSGLEKKETLGVNPFREGLEREPRPTDPYAAYGGETISPDLERRPTARLPEWAQAAGRAIDRVVPGTREFKDLLLEGPGLPFGRALRNEDLRLETPVGEFDLGPLVALPVAGGAATGVTRTALRGLARTAPSAARAAGRAATAPMARRIAAEASEAFTSAARRGRPADAPLPKTDAIKEMGQRAQATRGFTDEIAAARQAMARERGRPLGIHSQGQLQKAREVWKQVTSDDLAEGLTWYSRVRGLIGEVSRATGIPYQRIAAVIAATSPQTPWPRNLAAALDHIEAFASGRPKLKTGTLVPGMDGVARDILEGVDPAVALSRSGLEGSGKKFRSFFANFMDDESVATVDTWMGRLFGLPEGKGVDPKLYDQLDDAIGALAQETGKTRAQTQAVLWTTFKRLSGEKPGALFGPEVIERIRKLPFAPQVPTGDVRSIALLSRGEIQAARAGQGARTIDKLSPAVNESFARWERVGASGEEVARRTLPNVEPQRIGRGFSKYGTENDIHQVVVQPALDTEQAVLRAAAAPGGEQYATMVFHEGQGTHPAVRISLSPITTGSLPQTAERVERALLDLQRRGKLPGAHLEVGNQGVAKSISIVAEEGETGPAFAQRIDEVLNSLKRQGVARRNVRFTTGELVSWERKELTDAFGEAKRLGRLRYGEDLGPRGREFGTGRLPGFAGGGAGRAESRVSGGGIQEVSGGAGGAGRVVPPGPGGGGAGAAGPAGARPLAHLPGVEPLRGTEGAVSLGRRAGGAEDVESAFSRVFTPKAPAELVDAGVGSRFGSSFFLTPAGSWYGRRDAHHAMLLEAVGKLEGYGKGTGGTAVALERVPAISEKLGLGRAVVEDRMGKPVLDIALYRKPTDAQLSALEEIELYLQAKGGHVAWEGLGAKGAKEGVESLRRWTDPMRMQSMARRARKASGMSEEEWESIFRESEGPPRRALREVGAPVGPQPPDVPQPPRPELTPGRGGVPSPTEQSILQAAQRGMTKGKGKLRFGKGGNEPTYGMQLEKYSEPVRTIMRSNVATLEDDLAAKVAAMPTSESKIMAEELGFSSADEMVEALPNRGQLVALFTKARMDVARGIEHNLTVAAKPAHLRTEAERAGALLAFKDAVAAQAALHEGASELGRALSSLRMQIDTAMAKGKPEVAVKAAIKAVAANPEMEDAIFNAVLKYQDDPVRLYHLLRDARKHDWVSRWREYSKANALTGLPTHETNTASGVYQVGLYLTDALVRDPKHTIPALHGLTAGIREAWNRIPFILAESPVLPGGRVDPGLRYDAGSALVERFVPRGTIPGRLGGTIRAPFKALQIMDAFQTGIVYNIEVRRLAQVAADANKLPVGSRERARFVTSFIIDPPTPSLTAALEAGNEYTLKGRNALVDWLVQGREKWRGLDPLLMFVQAPVNVQKLGTRFSPLGLLRLVDRELLTADLATNAAMRSKAMKILVQSAGIGGLTTAGFYTMLESGDFTGLVPRDRAEYQAWQAEGKQPLSIRASEYPIFGPLFRVLLGPDADKTFVTAALLGPLLVPAMIASAVREFQNKNTDLPLEERVSTAAAAAGFAMLQTVPMYQGLRQANNLLNADVEQIGSFIGNYLRLAIPASSLVGSVERMSDDLRRDPEGILESIKAQLPLLAQELYPQRDALNHPLPQDNTGLRALLPRLAIERPNPVIAEQARLEKLFGDEFSMFKRAEATDLGKIEADRAELERYRDLLETQLEPRLSKLMNSPAYISYPDEAKRDVWTKEVQLARATAKKALADELMLDASPVKQAKAMRLKMVAAGSNFDRFRLVEGWAKKLEGSPELQAEFDKFTGADDLKYKDYALSITVAERFQLKTMPLFADAEGRPVGDTKVWEQYFSLYDQWKKLGKNEKPEGRSFYISHPLLVAYHKLEEREGGANNRWTALRKLYPVLDRIAGSDRTVLELRRFQQP